MASIGKLEAVPVDVSGAEFWYAGSRPAMRLEGGVETRKVDKSTGISGTEFDLVAGFPDADAKATLKVTVYSTELLDFQDFEVVRPVGLRAAVWTANGKGGMWFAADGVERVASAAAKSAPRQEVKA